MMFVGDKPMHEDELYNRVLEHMIYDDETGRLVGLTEEATPEEWAFYRKITTPDENGELPIICI